MVYLVNDNGKVRVFYSESEMKAAAFNKAGLTVSEENFNSNGCYARLVDGEIIVGKTEAERAEQEKREQVAEYIGQLEEIDRVSGAGRHVRDVSVSAGVVLNAVRTILSRFARELNIQIPSGFGKGLTTAEELLNLAPGEELTPEEIEDFYVYKSLLLLTHYDPAINPGLTEMKKAEEEAKAIREQLAPLLSAPETDSE